MNWPNMKPKVTHRYRICGTPVRTGCITCKIRRIKCGEEKPYCKRCTSTGRNCDGYATPVKTDSPSESLPSNSLPLTPSEDEAMEQRTLSFFSTFTVPQLSRNFSSDFWERRVVQASAVEPSIRHAVIAIGAIHQDFILRHEGDSKKQDPSIEAFAFRQYTKAISHLHRLMSTRTQQLDITLITCILFICFDCLLGNHTSAIIHLKAGLKILEDIKLQNACGVNSVQTTSAHEWEREFAPLLLGLGVQAASFVNPKYRKDRTALWTALKRAGIPTHPTRFASLDEARHALDTLEAEIMKDRTSTNDHITEYKIPNPNGLEAQRHTSALKSWEEALNRSFEDTLVRDTLPNKTRFGVSMLKMHSLVLSIVIGMPDPADEKFEEVLSLCESLVAKRTDCTCTSSSLNFSTDMGVIAPLFFTALKAPQKSLQRQAYDLLLRAPGREGMWDTDDALRVAAEAVGITYRQEHSGTSAMPRPCPQHESKAWDHTAVKLQNRVFHSRPSSGTNGVPSTQSTPTRPGLPFTIAEYLTAEHC